MAYSSAGLLCTLAAALRHRRHSGGDRRRAGRGAAGSVVDASEMRNARIRRRGRPPLG